MERKQRTPLDRQHRKKMIAPIVITALVVLYYIGVAAAFTAIAELPRIPMILMLTVPLAIAAAMIWMLAERIKEIRSGEEDDLGQY